MSIVYYSNFCDPSKKLLQKISKTKLSQEIHFICIDRRQRDSKGNTILLLEKEQVMLPSQVTKVPALYKMESKQVLFGDDIYSFLLPREVAINHQATNGNGEPECYSLSQMSSMSDSYSFWDQDPTELSTKGGGGTRQMHNYVTLDQDFKINTPAEDYEPDKVGKNGSGYSGGQMAMIWFLRAAMQKCSLIISDEASAALDPQSRKQIKKMIDIIARDKSVIVITHDEEMTVGMDRIITLDKGKIISDIKGSNKNSKNSNNGNRWS